MENDETKRCLLCGEHFSSSEALSQHWKDSPCRLTSTPVNSTHSTVAPVSSTDPLETITGDPLATAQEQIIQVDSDAVSDSHNPNDMCSTGLESKTNEEDGEESSTLVGDSAEVAEAEPLQNSSSSSVAASSSVMPVSILLTQQVGVVTETAKDGNIGSLIAGDFSHIPEGETHIEGVVHQDSELSQIPATVHLQPDALLGQVAMEIHIPMHTQLVVSDYMEDSHQTEKGGEIYFIEGKGLESEGKHSAIELQVPKVSWAYEERVEKEKLPVQSKRRSGKTSKIKKFCCEECGKTYSKSSNLYRHKNVHLGKKFPCDLCGKVYSYMETLKAHKECHHREPMFGGLHKCKYCPRQYSSAVKLGVHLRSHTYDKPFPCSECQKTFSTIGGLKKHQVIHTSIKAFQCEICSKKFLRKPALEKHKLIHSADRSYKCSLCSKVFSDQYSHRSHKCIHYPDRPYGCHFCPKRFKSPSALEVHEKIHTRAKIHACAKCNYRCGTSHELKMHLRSHWKVDAADSKTLERNQCRECGAKFTQSSTLRAHERTHTGEMPFVCEICQKPFTYYSSWKRHLQIHRGEKAHHCKKCGMGFTKGLYLQRHEKSFCHAHNNSVKKSGKRKKQKKTAKINVSDEIQNSEPRIHNTQRESKANHEPEVSESCANENENGTLEVGNLSEITVVPEPVTVDPEPVTVDPKPATIVPKPTTVDPKSLSVDVENHSEVTGVPTHGTRDPKAVSVDVGDALEVGVVPKPSTFASKSATVCEVCGKIYKSNSNLQRHLKTHQDKKPFKCEHCGKSYSRRPILKEHLLMVHGEGPKKTLFQCTDCTQSYPTLRRLEIHKRKHTGERPYKCQYCPKTFKESSNLKRHEIIHSGLKPYVCVVCDRGFSDRGNLQKHELTHGIKSGESRKNVETWKPFSCEVCGKSFEQLGYLRYHTKMHEAERLYSCLLCDRKFSQPANLTVHLKTHTRKSFKCDKCRASFRTEAKLLAHQEKWHENKKGYVCGKCGKVLSSKNSLQRHENKHLGLKPYKCPLCSSSFTEKVSLKRHMSTHKDDENILYCNVCDAVFTSKDSFDKHVASKSCLSTHKCDKCEKEFTSSIGLSRHKRSHRLASSSISVKPKVYVCDVCDKHFEKKKLLLRHKKAHKDIERKLRKK